MKHVLVEPSKEQTHWKTEIYPATASPVTPPPNPLPPVSPRVRQPQHPLARFHRLRRWSDKLTRRIKKLAGKTDNSPWILDPPKRASSTVYVDFLFGLDYLSPNAPLVKLLQQAMVPHGLSILLVNNLNVEKIKRQIERGWLWPHVYLDLCSAYEKRFEDLMMVAAGKGIQVIDDPAHLTSWTFKASSHPRLLQAGLPVPPTVILPRNSPDRDLTADELALVGNDCVMKPSIGWANRGVRIGIAPTRQNIAAARDFDRTDDWLIQKKITWTRCGNRAGYIRAYYLLGHRSLLWWSRENGHDAYELLTWDDLKTYDLLPAVQIVDRIAALSGVDFFCSENALTEATGPDRFVLIDYINDQCDMDPVPRAGTTPVPEPWVRWVCSVLGDFAWRKKCGVAPVTQRTLTLF
jgi:hypothetical protein